MCRAKIILEEAHEFEFPSINKAVDFINGQGIEHKTLLIVNDITDREEKKLKSRFPNIKYKKDETK